MISVVLDWNGQTTVSPTIFDGIENIDIDYLQSELLAVDPSVAGVWFIDPTLHVVIDSADVVGKQAAINAVIAAHVPVEYENRPSVMYSGTTNASGELVIVFDKTYRVEPEIFMEAVEDQSHKNVLISKSETGCVCKVVSTPAVDAAILGLTILTEPVDVQGAHITVDVRQRPENL